MTTPVKGSLFTAGRDDHGRRLERILRKLFSQVPLSQINKALRKGDIRVGGRKAKADYRVEEGDIIEVRAPFGKEAERPARKGTGPAGGRQASGRLPEGIALDVVFRNENLLAVNKPAGVSVHGAESLTGAVRNLVAGQLGESLSFRPGPLHRLDKQTTGVIVYSLSLEGAKRFSAALKERALTKIYLALLRGKLSTSAEWRDVLESEEKSQDAELTVLPLLHFDDTTLAICVPKTGRTHQIRKQAALHGHPLVGDHAYQGDRTGPPLPGGYVLHALSLSAPPEREVGFDSILAPLQEESANRLAGFASGSGRIELALPEGGASEQISRLVERLREEPGALPFLLSNLATVVHERREELLSLHGSR